MHNLTVAYSLRLFQLFTQSRDVYFESNKSFNQREVPNISSVFRCLLTHAQPPNSVSLVANYHHTEGHKCLAPMRGLSNIHNNSPHAIRPALDPRRLTLNT